MIRLENPMLWIGVSDRVPVRTIWLSVFKAGDWALLKYLQIFGSDYYRFSSGLDTCLNYV